MHWLDVLVQREVFIALAVSGALVATAGGYLLRKNSDFNPATARFILRSGYAISWLSVAIFIAAGFRSGW
jgi:hypothetical protein